MSVYGMQQASVSFLLYSVFTIQRLYSTVSFTIQFLPVFGMRQAEIGLFCYIDRSLLRYG